MCLLCSAWQHSTRSFSATVPATGSRSRSTRDQTAGRPVRWYCPTRTKRPGSSLSRRRTSWYRRTTDRSTCPHTDRCRRDRGVPDRRGALGSGLSRSRRAGPVMVHGGDRGRRQPTTQIAHRRGIACTPVPARVRPTQPTQVSRAQLPSAYSVAAHPGVAGLVADPATRSGCAAATAARPRRFTRRLCGKRLSCRARALETIWRPLDR
jgi:hypothetical protein